jgi:putative ABC transport system ATP-binding protein
MVRDDSVHPSSTARAAFQYGRVNIGTYDIGKLSDAEISRLRGTEIGVVLQGAARNLLPYATLSRNSWLAQTRAAGTRGLKWDDPERILDLVGLGGQGRARVDDLAPGARQRAALAVGIAAGPGLLLVDEPTSQLDTAGRDEVVHALETVNAERGTTIVVVTHDSEVGDRLGRAVTIRDGRVSAEGRGGQDVVVVAGDGTVQLPPEVLGDSRRARCSLWIAPTAASRWFPAANRPCRRKGGPAVSAP